MYKLEDNGTYVVISQDDRYKAAVFEPQRTQLLEEAENLVVQLGRGKITFERYLTDRDRLITSYAVYIRYRQGDSYKPLFN